MSDPIVKHISDRDAREAAMAALLNAFVKAVADFENLKPDAVNPAFRKNGKGGGYVTLPSVLEAIRPVLAKHGLALTQFLTSSEGRVGVRSYIVGHGTTWLVGDPSVKVPDGATIQAVGSAMSYLKRQSIFAALSISASGSEVDDDGNAASGAKAGDTGW